MEDRRAHWEERYREGPPEELPWFHPGLDHDISRALEELGIKEGRVLDLGCGPGTQAVELARMGLSVTATDIAEGALRCARKRAEEAGVEVEFVRDDILDSRLKGPYDLIVDRGCFHTLPREGFERYVETTHRLLRPGGWLFLKCFSHKERREEGPPNRLSPEEIRSLFGGSFRIHAMRESFFASREGTPPLAIFAILKKG